MIWTILLLESVCIWEVNATKPVTKCIFSIVIQLYTLRPMYRFFSLLYPLITSYFALCFLIHLLKEKRSFRKSQVFQPSLVMLLWQGDGITYLYINIINLLKCYKPALELGSTDKLVLSPLFSITIRNHITIIILITYVIQLTFSTNPIFFNGRKLKIEQWKCPKSKSYSYKVTAKGGQHDDKERISWRGALINTIWCFISRITWTLIIFLWLSGSIVLGGKGGRGYFIVHGKIDKHTFNLILLGSVK